MKRTNTKTVLRYNFNHSIDIYPSFSSDRWHQYDSYKTKRNQLKKQYDRILHLETLHHDQTKKDDLKIFLSEKSKVKRELDRYQKKMDAICPPYERNNKKNDGFVLNKNAKNKVQHLMHLLYETYTTRNFNFEFMTLTATSPNFKKQICNANNPLYYDNILGQQFQKFIKNLRKNYNLKQIVYVAERQTGKRIMDANLGKTPTNRIHYHCVMVWDGTPPNIQQINYYWLTLLEEIGFKTFNTYKLKKLARKEIAEAGTKEEKQFIKQKYNKALLFNQITEYCPNRGMGYNYEKRHNKQGELINNPLQKCIYHPVDVRKIKDIKELSSYLVKYVTKSDEKIFTRVWGATRELLKAKTKEYFYNIEGLLKEAEKNIKLHHKNKTPLDFTFDFQLSKDKNAPVYQFRKIFLNEASKISTSFSQIRNKLLTEFEQTIKLVPV